MHRYALRDGQGPKIKDFLPGRDGHVGGTAADNRLFVDAVVFLFLHRHSLARYGGALRQRHRRPSTLSALVRK